MTNNSELVYTTNRKLSAGGTVAETFVAIALPDDQNKFIIAKIKSKTDGFSRPDVTVLTWENQGKPQSFGIERTFKQVARGEVPKNYPLVDEKTVHEFIAAMNREISIHHS